MFEKVLVYFSELSSFQGFLSLVVPPSAMLRGNPSAPVCAKNHPPKQLEKNQKGNDELLLRGSVPSVLFCGIPAGWSQFEVMLDQEPEIDSDVPLPAPGTLGTA